MWTYFSFQARAVPRCLLFYKTIHFSIYSGSHNNKESSGTLQQRPRKMIPKIQCHALRRLTLSRLSVTVLLIDSMISREWYAYNSNYHWCTSKATTDFCYQHVYFPPKMLTKTAKYNNLVFWSLSHNFRLKLIQEI